MAYRYTSPSTRSVDLHLGLSSDGDHGLSVRAACSGTAAERACEDHISTAGEEDMVVRGVAPGTTFFIVVSAGNEARAAAFQLRAWETPVVSTSGSCDPLGLASRCADGLDCMPFSGSHVCRTHATAVANACAGAPTVTGGTYAGTTLNAPDIFRGACDPVPGTGDAFVEYLVAGSSGGPVDVDILVTGAGDPGISVLRGCDDTDVMACEQSQSGGESTSVRAVPAGTRLVLVVSSLLPGWEGAFQLQVSETASLAQGSACNVAGSCAPGLYCHPASSTCESVGVVSGVSARFTDPDGDGLVNGVVARATSTPADGEETLWLDVTPLDAAGRPLTMHVRASRYFTSFPPFSVEVPPAGPGPLTHTFAVPFLVPINVSSVAAMRVEAETTAGRSLPVTVPVDVALPLVAEGMSCTAFGAECSAPLKCRFGTCQATETQACAGAPLVGRGVQAIASTTAAPDMTNTNCSLAGTPDVVFRYVTQVADSLVTARIVGDGSHGLAIRSGCAQTTELTCDVGLDDGGLAVRGLPAGTTLFVVVSEEFAGAGTFSLVVDESTAPATGADCSFSVTGACPADHACLDDGDPDPLGTCQALPQFSANNVEVRTADTNADGTVDVLTARVTGLDSAPGVVRLDFVARNAAGRPLPMLRRVPGIPPQPQGSYQAGRSVAFADLKLDGTLGARFTGATLAPNLHQAALFDVVLQGGGQRRGVVVIRDVEVAALPLRAVGQSCDPARVLNECSVGSCLAPPAGGASQCFDDESYLQAACPLATSVSSGVLQDDASSSPIFLSDACGTGPSLLFRYTPAGSGDVLATLVDGPVAVSFRRTCTDAGTAGTCASAGTGPVAEARDVTAGVPITLVVTGLDAEAAFSLRISERPVVPAGSPCDPTGFAGRCATGSSCADRGSGDVCVPDVDLVCDTAAALGLGQTSLYLSAFDPFPSCAPGWDTAVSYTPSSATADVRITATGEYPVAIQQVDVCSASAAQLTCSPDGYLEVPNATGTVLLVLSQEFPGPVEVWVEEVPVRSMGEPCDPSGVADRCAAGLVCDVNGFCR